MNTVLLQELIRYNNLLATMKESLSTLLAAMKGLVLMNPDLEEVATSLANGWVPQLWRKVRWVCKAIASVPSDPHRLCFAMWCRGAQASYPSLKSLGSWIPDLLARIIFFQDWVDHGCPPVFWISGFFFTQSFLTGTLQDYARSHKLSIDTISFSFEVVHTLAEDIDSPPSDGCYVRGLFLVGCRWDSSLWALEEPHPCQLWCPLPVLWLHPKLTQEVEKETNSSHVLTCPVYKTSERRGQLSTTGHSTNFVLAVKLPMSAQHTETHWVRRGVALLCQLDS